MNVKYRSQRAFHAFVAACAALLASQALPAQAERPSPEAARTFEGTWRLDQPREEARRVVDEAVDDAANQFNFIARGIARSRLREGTPVHGTVVVSFEGDRVTVAFGSERYTTVLGRTEVRENPEGEEMRVTQRIRPNGQLEQIFETDSGTRRYIYTPLPDGRMRIATTTDSPQMPQPMYFMLDYERAA